MAAADCPIEIGALAPPRRMRHKSARRRMARDLRLTAPFVALGLVFLLTLGVSFGVEQLEPTRVTPSIFDGVGPTDLAYWPTISMSSTSNVNAAPPGILGGAPLSP
jgi:hypothetical protein